MPAALPLGSPRVVRFGPFELDLRAGELCKDDDRARLQEKPLRVLELLLRQPGEIVTREELRQALWPADTFVDFDGGLNTAVNKLRTALGDAAEQPRFIATVGRRGYRFIAPVDAAQPAPSTAAAPAQNTEHVPPPAGRLRVWLPGAGAAVVAAIALAALWWTRASPLARSSFKSLAVLPLDNLSNQSDDEYFADGITDAVITDLARIHSLRVISRQSVMRYKKSSKSLPEIARELNVEAIVEGSVVRSGGRVRINAQLLDASDRHLWARSYEREVGDLLALQSEIARTVAGEVQATLTAQERTHLTRSAPVHPEAYDLYLRGRYFFNTFRGAPDMDATVRKAIGYFRDAVAKDPAFAPAHAAISEALAILAYHGYVAPPEASPAQKTHALKALELDENLASAHNAWAAYLSGHEYDWSGAEREHRRAIELDPSYWFARDWFAYHLDCQGRHAEAVEQRRRALETDPFNLILMTRLGWSLGLDGRHDEAIRMHHRALELDPEFKLARGYLGGLYADMGRYTEAIAEWEKAGAKRSIAWTDAQLGRPGQLRQDLATTEQRAKQRYVSPLIFAHIHAGLGNTDRAFAYLEEAYVHRVPTLTWLKQSPWLTPLRSDPRFADLLRRMKLS